MTQKNLLVRPSLGAIAALIALSATPAVAQVADPVTDTAAPVETPAPASDPLSPEQTSPADPAPVEATTTTAETTSATAATTTARKSTTSARTASRATPVRTASSAPASNVAAPAAQAEIAPAVPVLPEPAAEPQALPPVAPFAAPQDSGNVSSDLLPIAGAAGLGVLAILGIGLVLRRRRTERVVEDADYVEPAFVAAAPAAEAVEPKPMPERSAFTWGNRASQPVADVPTTNVPRGFDLSRFGRHVQAAYRGPSADNPSLSLKKRIKRASFFDLRERQAAKAGAGSRPAFSTGFAYRKPEYAY